MTQKFSNNASTTLAAGIDDAATTVTVADDTPFCALGTGEHEIVTLEKADASAREVVKVTARSGATWTVERAQEGTTAAAWSSGDKVEARATAGTLERFVQCEPAAVASPFGAGSVNIQPSRSNDSQVAAENGVAIGTNSKTYPQGVALGHSTTAGMQGVVAGFGAASYPYGVALGANSDSDEDGAIAIGEGAISNNIAIGRGAGSQYQQGILIGQGVKAPHSNTDIVVIGNGQFLTQYGANGHYVQGVPVYPLDTFGAAEGSLTGSVAGIKTPMLDLGVPPDWNTNDKYNGSIVKPVGAADTVQYRLKLIPGTTYINEPTEPTWPGNGNSVEVAGHPGCYWIGQDPQTRFNSEQYGDDNSIFVATHLYFVVFEADSSDSVVVDVGMGASYHDNNLVAGHALTRTTSNKECFAIALTAPFVQWGSFSFNVDIVTPATYSFRGWFFLLGHMFEGVATY